MASRSANYSFNTKSTGSSKKRGNYSFTSNSSSPNNDVQKRIKNYKTRLKNIDDDKDVTDKRNWLEKKLGLKQDQNVLFDIFELLGRPQQALFGAIDAAQKGKDVSEGAEKGWKGKKEYTGGQLLRQAGMKGNGKFNLFDKKSYKNASASDFLGFGLDMLLDPVDLSLIGVTAATGGAAAPATVPAIAGTAAKGAKVASKGAKVVKTANTISDASKAIKAANAVKKAGNVYDVVRTADKASDAVKTIKRAGDVYDAARIAENAADATKVAKKTNAFKRIMTRGAKPTGIKIGNKEIGRQSLSQIAMNTLGEGIKGGGKIADFGIEKILGKIDSKQLRKIEKLANKTGESVADITRKVGGKSDLLGTYKALKKGFSNTIDSSKMLGGLVGKTRRSANNVDLADAIASAKAKELRAGTRQVAEDIALKTGRNSDEVMDELSKNLTRYIEFEQDTTIDGAKFLNNLSSKSNKFTGTKNSVDAMEKVINKYNDGVDNAYKIVFKKADDGKSLVINTKKTRNLGTFKNSVDIQDAFNNLNLQKDLGYSPKQLRELKQIGKRFGKGGDLEDLYQTNKKAYQEISDIYKKYTGVDFSDITTREGYLKRARGELIDDADRVGAPYGRGTTDTRTFGSRKHTAPAEVENVRRQEKIASDIRKTEKQIETTTNQLSDNRKAILESQKADIEFRRAEKIKKYNDNLAKAGSKQAKIEEGLKKCQQIRSDITSKLDDKTIKNISKIQDKAISSPIAKLSDDINKYSKEYNNLVSKLSNSDLTEKEIASLNKQVEKLANNMSVKQAILNKKIDAVNDFTKNRTDMILKNTNSAMSKSEKNAVKEAKLTSQLGETLEKTKLLAQAQEDSIEQFDRILNRIETQINGIDPANDKKLLDKLERLEKKKVMLASQEGKDLFNLDFYAGLDTFLDQSRETAKGVSIYGDALAMGTLNNPDYIKTMDNLAEDMSKKTGKSVEEILKNPKDIDVPQGFTKINGDVLANQFEGIKNFLPENSDTFKTLADDFKGKTLYIDKDFARLMNVNKNSKEQANALVKVIDGFNNMFKKYKILTPGFQVRNIAGNATNMVLSGMPAGRIPEYYAKAGSVLNNSEKLLAKASNGVEFTAKEAKQWKLLQQFYEGGFKDAGTRMQDLEQLRKTIKGKKGPLNFAAEVNAKMNEGMDGLNRMALLMYANDHPKYVQKLGKANPIEAVKYALMDPSNMSDFEKGAMKRIIPFYTFTKQNLLFQATNMMNNTPKYHRLIKGFDKTYDSLNENEYWTYQKEGMQIPLPATDKKGNRLFLKTNLPLSDLGEFMSNPLRRTISSTTPLIKTPYEMVTGKDVFTGNDVYKNVLNDFTQATTGQELSESGKKWATRAEQLLSGLGIDTITTNNIKKVSSILKNHNGDMDSQAMWAEIFRSVLQNTNQSKIENAKAYQEMLDYQEYVKSLKNQGTDVPTIKDITTHNKTSLTRAKRRRSRRGNYSFTK